MQSLEIISINIWQTLISLCNLLLLFLIIKKFLYKPVKKALKKRKDALQNQYDEAQNAENAAVSLKKEWEDKISGAQDEADRIVKASVNQADMKSDKIIAEAREKADDIVHQAEEEAKLERKKAEKDMKQEIVDISTLLTEKILVREINEDDHRNLIDGFVDEIGDGDDADR